MNTGLLDDDKATPIPESSAVSFSKPGTYQTPYCIVHGAEMKKGSITVTQ